MTIHNLTQNTGLLADEHAELCLGLKTLLQAGVPVEELGFVLERLCEQAEDIQMQHGKLAMKPTASESKALPNMTTAVDVCSA